MVDGEPYTRSEVGRYQRTVRADRQCLLSNLAFAKLGHGLRTGFSSRGHRYRLLQSFDNLSARRVLSKSVNRRGGSVTQRFSSDYGADHQRKSARCQVAGRVSVGQRRHVAAKHEWVSCDKADRSDSHHGATALAVAYWITGRAEPPDSRALIHVKPGARSAWRNRCSTSQPSTLSPNSGSHGTWRGSCTWVSSHRR